jgi:hypothetical protein
MRKENPRFMYQRIINGTDVEFYQSREGVYYRYRNRLNMTVQSKAFALAQNGELAALGAAYISTQNSN